MSHTATRAVTSMTKPHLSELQFLKVSGQFKTVMCSQGLTGQVCLLKHKFPYIYSELRQQAWKICPASSGASSNFGPDIPLLFQNVYTAKLLLLFFNPFCIIKYFHNRLAQKHNQEAYSCLLGLKNEVWKLLEWNCVLGGTAVLEARDRRLVAANL